MNANNFNKLINDFGCELMDDNMLNLFKLATGYEPFMWFERHIIFGHRDLDIFLEEYKNKKNLYIYTAIEPLSQKLHIGHVVQLFTTAWLQQVFNIPVIIQILDNKITYSDNIEYSIARKNAFSIVEDIIRFGFSPTKTYIYFERDQTNNPSYMKSVFDIMNNVNVSDMNKILQIDGEQKLGDMISPILHIAPSFGKSFPLFLSDDSRCLIVCSADKDPYTMLARDIADHISQKQPASIIYDNVPSLKSVNDIMSYKDPDNCIFISDNKDNILTKKLESYVHDDDNISTSPLYQYLLLFEDNETILNDVYEGYNNKTFTLNNVKDVTKKQIFSILYDLETAKINNNNKIDDFMVSENITTD